MKDVYEWKVHPIKDNIAKAIFATIYCVIFVVLAYFYSESLILTVVITVLLLGSLKQFFLPTYYKIDLVNDEITIKILFLKRQEKISKYKKIYLDKNGVFLSAQPDSKFLDQFRGLFLITNNNKEEIYNLLKKCIKND